MEEASCKKHWVSVTESVVTRMDVSNNWKYPWGNTTVTVFKVQQNRFVKIEWKNVSTLPSQQFNNRVKLYNKAHCRLILRSE